MTQAEEDTLPKEKQMGGQAVNVPPKQKNRLHKANWRNNGSCLKANLVSILQNTLQKPSLTGMESYDLHTERY